MHVLRVVTVDDEPLARERVSGLVRAAHGLELVAEGTNGLEALDLITTLDPDLVFIDVEMPELSGFGVIAALDGSRVPGMVFVTAYEHYALQAFDVGVIDYLHKPVTRQRFDAAVDRARARLDQSSAADVRAVLASAARAERARGHRSRYVVKHGNTHHFVPVEEVDWIDVADNYLQLHVGGRAFLHRGTMKDAEAELDPSQFVRIHRRAIVAIDRIASIASQESGRYLVELRNGVRLHSSRLCGDRVRSLLR